MTDMIFPAELTPELREALGFMNFHTVPLAHLFRKSGKQIKERVEDEQAFVLHWFVTLALQHGPTWREHVSNEVTRLLDELKAKEEAVRDGKPKTTGTEGTTDGTQQA